MISIGMLVEGYGEVDAGPTLVRRIAKEILRAQPPLVARPFRTPKSRLARPEAIERAVDFLAIRSGAGGRILVLVDADQDCPVALAQSLVQRAKAARQDRRIEVVVAKVEFEAWLIAGIHTLHGRFGVDAPAPVPGDCESIRDAKGWLHSRIDGGYKPTIDQDRLTREIGLDGLAARSRSFAKLVRAVDALIRGG